MTQTSLQVELSNEEMDSLVAVASGDDEQALATVATEIPRLVLEINRLRDERDEKVKALQAAKRGLAAKDAYIESLRARADAGERLREVEGQLTELATTSERIERERNEAQRSVKALEGSVRTLRAAILEMGRGTGAEQFIREAEEQRERAERAEAALEELKAQR